MRFVRWRNGPKLTLMTAIRGLMTVMRQKLPKRLPGTPKVRNHPARAAVARAPGAANVGDVDGAAGVVEKVVAADNRQARRRRRECALAIGLAWKPYASSR